MTITQKGSEGFLQGSNALDALTFNGNDMLSDLVLQQRILHPLQQLVDRVDVRMDGLEPLNLSSDRG